MMQKMALCGLFAGFSLAVVSATAAAVTETFESADVGTAVKSVQTTGATWGGYGSVSNVASAIACSDAMPTSGSHAKVLSVDGYVVCTNSVAMGGSPVVDMLVQVARPEDALALPTSETGDPIQIAVGVDADGALKVYSNGKGGTAGWTELKSGLTEGSWVRVSFLFDYAAKRCQVRVDGQPVMTAAGYLTATTADGTAAGAWYALVDNAKTTLGNVKVVGSTAIDEIVMSNESDYVYPLLSTLGTDEVVPHEWFDKKGIAWNEGAQYDNSGLTVKQKWAAGLDPFDNSKLALTSMSMKTEGDTDKVTLGLPKMTPPEGQKAVIDVSSDPSFSTKTTSDVSAEELSAQSKTLALPSGNVFYYRLRATAATAQ